MCVARTSGAEAEPRATSPLAIATFSESVVFVIVMSPDSVCPAIEIVTLVPLICR
jgi:hypothetical protein